MKILVTGGLGYIGSHTTIQLIQDGHDVVILDDLSNCDRAVLVAVQKITHRNCEFYEGDIRNKALLTTIFENNDIDAVIHFAGLKSVSESVQKPLDYYANNVVGATCLLESMDCNGVKNIIFSSSASVYGNPRSLPISEEHLLNPNNPYANTKKQIEEIMHDLVESDNSWKVVILRYFNPVGAHPSRLIGENPKGLPANLVPFITKVAREKGLVLPIYGDNYPTKDGTGVRDYIHITDLAKGHSAALTYLSRQDENPAIFNLGRGHGVSVLEMVSAFELVNGVSVEYRIVEPRKGDVAECYADNAKACSVLDWAPECGVSDMCESAWDFVQNPGKSS